MATRYRKVNMYGNRYVIELMQIDIQDLNLKVGDLVDIEDAVYKTSISDYFKKKFDEVENEQ
jgi:uncharacterized membrane protein (UPF0127 family)